MRVVALIENSKLEGREDLIAEHGLSLYIESEDKRILFDTGASEAFAHNATRLGVDLQDVDALVISHHHFDHGGGLARFLETNQKATVYLGKSDQEAYYFRLLGFLSKYIGLDQDLLQAQADRFEYVDRLTEILPNVYLLAEITQPYARPKGNRRLVVKTGRTYVQDPFEHELAMVVCEGGELVVFTGCGHTGILNIMATVTRQFPDVSIKAVFGGFHLIGLPILNTMAGSKQDVRSIGEEMQKYPVERVYTGHCTGMKAYRVLKEVMAERLALFPTGSDMVL